MSRVVKFDDYESKKQREAEERFKAKAKPWLEGFDLNTEAKEINLKDSVDHKLNNLICSFSKD